MSEPAEEYGAKVCKQQNSAADETILTRAFCGVGHLSGLAPCPGLLHANKSAFFQVS